MSGTLTAMLQRRNFETELTLRIPLIQLHNCVELLKAVILNKKTIKKIPISTIMHIKLWYTDKLHRGNTLITM